MIFNNLQTFKLINIFKDLYIELHKELIHHKIILRVFDILLIIYWE